MKVDVNDPELFDWSKESGIVFKKAFSHLLGDVRFPDIALDSNNEPYIITFV